MEGVVEMTCTLNIDANLISDIRGYKYVVYSPKMMYEDDCYEYLHTFSGKYYYYTDPNRCLKIDRASLDSKLTIDTHLYVMIALFDICSPDATAILTF